MMNALKPLRPKVMLVTRTIVANDNGEILAVQRSATDTHLPGHWEFPGGKVDRYQTIEEAKKRENYEETGLLVCESHPLSFTISHHIQSPGHKYHGMLYVGNFHLAKVIGGTLAVSDEHDDAKWVTFEQFLELNPVAPESWEAAIIFHDLNLL